MRRIVRVGGWLAAFLAFMVGLGLFSSPERVTASDDTVTSVLQPGWNLAGWTERAAPVETIFERIPELQVVYSWDAGLQRFRLAMRTDPGGLGDLRRLTPGMALWLRLGGEDSVTWTRPLVREASVARLLPGWNLVVWAGENGAPANDALRAIDDILVFVSDADGRAVRSLATGAPVWVDVDTAREWDQVYEPPRIEFLAGLPPYQEREVRDYVDDVVAFYFQRLGFRVSGVEIRYGDPELFGCSGAYDAPVILMAACLDVFAHEYVHAIQEYLVAGGAHPPLWLREGDANFWAALYDDARGRRDYARHLREQVLPQARSEGFVSRGLHSYHSYHIRVHVLVKREGPDALLQFYRRTSVLGDWQQAFEETYGMTVAEFNVMFAQEMLLAPDDPSQACPGEWYEPVKAQPGPSEQTCGTIHGVVTDLAGNPRSGVEVGAVQGTIGSHDDGSRDVRQTTGPDGKFSFSVSEGSYSLSLVPVSLAPDLWPSSHWYSSQWVLAPTHSLAGQVSATAHPEELVVAYGVIAGVIVSENGRPVPGIHTGVTDSRGRGQSGPAPGHFSTSSAARLTCSR